MLNKKSNSINVWSFDGESIIQDSTISNSFNSHIANITINAPDQAIEQVKDNPKALQASLDSIARVINEGSKALPDGYKPIVEFKDGKAEIFSVPKNKEAEEKYPQRVKVDARIKEVNTADKNINDIFRRSFIEQKPIPINVLSMQKYIGDFIDPFQREFQENWRKAYRYELVPPPLPCYVADIGIEGCSTKYEGVVLQIQSHIAEEHIVRFESDPEQFCADGCRGLGFRLTYNMDTGKLDFSYCFTRPDWDSLEKYLYFMQAAVTGAELYVTDQKTKQDMFRAKLKEPLLSPDVADIDFSIQMLKNIKLIQAQYSVRFECDRDYNDEEIRLVFFIANSIRGISEEFRWNSFSVKGVLRPTETLKALCRGGSSIVTKEALARQLGKEIRFGYDEKARIKIGHVILEGITVHSEFESARIDNSDEIIEMCGDKLLGLQKDLPQIEMKMVPGSSNSGKRIVVVK